TLRRRWAAVVAGVRVVVLHGVSAAVVDIATINRAGDGIRGRDVRAEFLSGVLADGIAARGVWDAAGVVVRGAAGGCVYEADPFVIRLAGAVDSRLWILVDAPLEQRH